MISWGSVEVSTKEEEEDEGIREDRFLFHCDSVEKLKRRQAVGYTNKTTTSMANQASSERDQRGSELGGTKKVCANRFYIIARAVLVGGCVE